VESRFGTLTVHCEHDHSPGDGVHLLVRPMSTGSESVANIISGVVEDAIFQQDRFKVTLDNGLYVYLPEGPEAGESIEVGVKVECLA
jgi:hypothetical protein